MFDLREIAAFGIEIVLALLACSLILNFLQFLRPRPDVNAVRRQATRLAHSWMDPAVPKGVSIFLGDSITQSLATAAVAPYSVNYGTGSRTSAHLLQDLPGYVSLKRAGAIFLMIGMNDLMEGAPPRYREILDLLPDKVPLIWSAVMPSTLVPFASIHAANAEIRKLCAMRPNSAYVNTWDVLSENGGDEAQHVSGR